jgi:DNA-binding response OmpR family regulator
MTAHRALTVTQDHDLRSDCTKLLTDIGFSVTAVPDGRLAMEAARLQRPHLVMVGNGDGDADVTPLVQAMRRHFDPLLVVVDHNHSSRSEILSWGADTVLTTPLDGEAIRGQLDLLRSRPQPSLTPAGQWPELWTFEDLTIDIAAREVHLDGIPISLTRTEFDLLAGLASTPRRVLSRDQLIETVWGLDWYSDGHLLDVHIGNLRQKLGESGRSQRFIETVRGVGFRFNPHPKPLSSGDSTAPSATSSSGRPEMAAAPATVAPGPFVPGAEPLRLPTGTQTRGVDSGTG